MTKQEETNNSESCLNKAHQNELMFILLQRDIAAPATIRFWCDQRVAMNKNRYEDVKIQEALLLAEEMERIAL